MKLIQREKEEEKEERERGRDGYCREGERSSRIQTTELLVAAGFFQFYTHTLWRSRAEKHQPEESIPLLWFLARVFMSVVVYFSQLDVTSHPVFSVDPFQESYHYENFHFISIRNKLKSGNYSNANIKILFAISFSSLANLKIQ